MAAPNDTRARMLSTAATLFRRQGYNATGLNQILTESRAPKGSLYFHFPQGKEQLAAEAVAQSGAGLGLRMAGATAGAPDARAAVVAVAALLAQGLAESDFQEGCPVATVALESATGSEPIRTACADTYAAWLQGLAARLRHSGVAEREAGELADLVLASLQGALLLARVRRDVAVIHSVGEQVGAVVAQAVRNTTSTGGEEL